MRTVIIKIDLCFLIHGQNYREQILHQMSFWFYRLHHSQ